jgi:hypothetical protein
MEFKYMKKILGLIVVSTLLLFVSPIIKAAPIEYKSEEYGISFTVPEGWTEVSIDDSIVKKQYINFNDVTLSFGYADVWETLTEDQKVQIKRSDFNNNGFTVDGIKNLFIENGHSVNSINEITINGIEYFKTYTTDANGSVITYILYHNGIMYNFYFENVNVNSQEYKDYESFLSSIKYDNINTFSSNTNMLKSIFGLPINWTNESLIITIISSVLLTFLFYSGPVIIYRYIIKKEPVSSQEAKKLTFKFGLVMVIIVVILGTYYGDPSPGGAVFLYSFINYNILKRGKLKNLSDSIDIEKIETVQSNTSDKIISNVKETKDESLIKNESINSSILFCSNCGKKNSEIDNFCRYCGFKLQKIDEEFVEEDEPIKEPDKPSLEILISRIPEYISQRKYQEAISIIDEYLISRVEVNEDENIINYNFDNLEEFLTFVSIKNDIKNKKVVWLRSDRGQLLISKAYALYELGKHQEALDTLKSIFTFNPIAVNARFEIFENLLKLNRIEEAKLQLKEIWPFLINSSDIAKYYRRRAFIQSELKNFKAAVLLLTYSYFYDRDISKSSEELLYIEYGLRNISKYIVNSQKEMLYKSTLSKKNLNNCQLIMRKNKLISLFTEEQIEGLNKLIEIYEKQNDKKKVMEYKNLLRIDSENRNAMSN